MKEYSDKVLEHYGVKGMRWGVRKAEEYAKRRRKLRGVEVAKSRKVYSRLSSETSGKGIRSMLKPEYVTKVTDKNFVNKLSTPLFYQVLFGTITNFGIRYATDAVKTGQTDPYGSNRKKLLRKIGAAALNATVVSIVDRQLGKNVLKRYDDSGKSTEKIVGWRTPEAKMTAALQLGLRTGEQFMKEIKTSKRVGKKIWDLEPKDLAEDVGADFAESILGKTWP
jgi:hypothetical protein